MEYLRVVVCGAGRTGHLSAVLFKQQGGVHVTLFSTRALSALNPAPRCLNVHLSNGTSLAADIDLFTDSPAAAFSDADIVIITVPAHGRAALLRTMAAHLPRQKRVFVGAIPGFCGFDWMAAKVLADVPRAVIWGMKDVAHTAFDLKPGASVRMGGRKRHLYVALHARETREAGAALLALLRRLYEVPVTLLASYLAITLTPGNSIMHPAVVYGLIGPYGQWHNRNFDERFCWWSECSELGAYFLERMDEENQAICRAVTERFQVDLSSVKPLRQEIVEAYGELIGDRRSMYSILRTNLAYNDIQAPLSAVAEPRDGFVFERKNRIFDEDVSFGLALLVELARRLAVQAPYLTEVFRWSVGYMRGMTDSSIDYMPQDWPEAAS